MSLLVHTIRRLKDLISNLYDYFPFKDLNWKGRYWWIRGSLNRKRSCGKKIRWKTKNRANKTKDDMTRKTGRQYDVYKCIWCHHYHVGGTVKPLNKS
jgi:hypothetical protein